MIDRDKLTEAVQHMDIQGSAYAKAWADGDFASLARLAEKMKQTMALVEAACKDDMWRLLQDGVERLAKQLTGVNKARGQHVDC